MKTYLSPVDPVHELSGYEPPTALAIFKRRQKGYLRLTAARAGAMPKIVCPLPADILSTAIVLATTKPTPELRRVYAGLVLAFLIIVRPGAATMGAADLSLSSQGLRVQQVSHKSEVRSQARFSHSFTSWWLRVRRSNEIPRRLLALLSSDGKS